MLKDEIRSGMMAAMKAKKVVEKEILRVAMGEITTEEGRHGKDMSDAAVEKILRKLVKSNGETIKATSDEQAKKTLAEEIAVLEAYLPKQLGEDEIVAALAVVADAIKAAGNDGQATGIAMKQLKSSGAAVDGKTVRAAVMKLRS